MNSISCTPDEKIVHLLGLFFMDHLNFVFFLLYQYTYMYSDYRKRWRDVISQHPGHSHGYKSVMAALLKGNIRCISFAKMTQNAKIFKSFVVQ